MRTMHWNFLSVRYVPPCFFRCFLRFVVVVVVITAVVVIIVMVVTAVAIITAINYH